MTTASSFILEAVLALISANTPGTATGVPNREFALLVASKLIALAFLLALVERSRGGATAAIVDGFVGRVEVAVANNPTI
jgi:hypothetical protein